MAKEILTGKQIKLSTPFVRYVVQSSSGNYFRSKGYDYHGGTLRENGWTADINKAKPYPRLGNARAIVTFFTRNYPNYPPPDILMISTDGAQVLDETERVKKAVETLATKKEKQALQQAKYTLQRAEQEKDRAEKELAAAQKKLKDAQNKTK